MHASLELVGMIYFMICSNHLVLGYGIGMYVIPIQFCEEGRTPITRVINA